MSPLEFYYEFLTGNFLVGLNLIFAYSIFWAPFVSAYAFFKLWKYYVNADWISKLKWVMVEVRLPKEVYKTPLSMEFILNTMNQGGTGTWYDQWWKGRQRDWFTLELVSTEGTVHFYIRMVSKYKNLIESQIYSQYPEAQVIEVSDYTTQIDYERGGTTNIWGTEFKLKKDDFYPIKTYVDYGMDKGFVDEKQRIEPMSPAIEFMGSLTKGEHLWIQIFVRATYKRYLNPKYEGITTWFSNLFEDKKVDKYRDWKGEAADALKKLIEEEKTEVKDGKTVKTKQRKALTPGEQETMKAIERSLTKVGFDCGIRGIYIANKDNFNSSNITGLAGSFKQYNTENLNAFEGTNSTDIKYPWQDYDAIRLDGKKKKLIKAYKMRGFYYEPYNHDRHPFILNSEELATIFHFPSGIAQTPTLERIESKRSEAPSNLPI